MGILFVGSASEHVRITTGIFDINAAYSIGGWAKADRTRPTNTGLYKAGEDGVYTSSDVVHLKDGGNVRAYVSNGAAFTQDTTTGTPWPDEAWFHIMAVRRSVTVLAVFVDGTEVLTITRDVTGRAAAEELVLNKFEGGNYGDLELSRWICVERELTAAEILSQMNATRPVDPRSIYAIWPFVPGTLRPNDWSGNANAWTENNTPSDSTSDPAIGWGGDDVLTIAPAAAAPTGAISGNATMSLTATGTVTGTGELSGGATASLTTTGTLSATGELAGGATASLAAAGTLSATGTLAGGATASLTSAGTLSATGDLAGSATMSLTAAGTLTAPGEIEGAATMSLTAAGTLTGTGTLAGGATMSLTATGELTQPGPISGAATMSLTAVGTLTATGTLAGGATMSLVGAGTISGEPLAIVTAGSWSSAVTFAAGDEWRIQITGPSADAPVVRIVTCFDAV